jgi:5-methylcytosine-specific restriction endonuclease McrA
MVALGLVVVPVVVWVTYSLFGWFGPIAALVIAVWLFWKSEQKAVKSRAEWMKRVNRAESHSRNSNGYRKPKVPRNGRRSGQYRSPYTNWRTVAKREKFMCHICGMKVDDDDFTRTESGRFVAGPMYPTVDHLTPQSKGGSHHWTNLKLAHKRCNSLKSNRENWDDIDPFAADE